MAVTAGLVAGSVPARNAPTAALVTRRTPLLNSGAVRLWLMLCDRMSLMRYLPSAVSTTIAIWTVTSLPVSTPSKVVFLEPSDKVSVLVLPSSRITTRDVR